MPSVAISRSESLWGCVGPGIASLRTVRKAAREPRRHARLDISRGTCYFPTIVCKARYRGGAYGKRVPFPHGRATVIGDERQQDEPLAGKPRGRGWFRG